jgi:hypothetical protein
MAVATIVSKATFGQLAFPVGVTAALLVIPPAITYLIWQTVPQVAADAIAIWQASPVFLVSLLVCAGIMTMLLPVVAVWGLWLKWVQRSNGAEPFIC